MIKTDKEPGVATDSYYTLLDIPPGATADALAAAYQHQRERYSLERVATLGDEFQRVTQARLADLERAYAVLADPARRQAYDQSIGIGAHAGANRRASRAGLSRREKLMALGGALAALMVIAAVWVLGGELRNLGYRPLLRQTGLRRSSRCRISMARWCA